MGVNIIRHIAQNFDAYRKIWRGLIAIGYINFFIAMGVSQYLHDSVLGMESGPLWLKVFAFGLLGVTVVGPLALMMAGGAVVVVCRALQGMVEGIREVSR